MSLSRSGRRIVYTNEVPFETDVLYTNLYKMIDVSNLAQAVLGGTGTSNATLVSGLIATPQSPANLTINISNGVIFTLSAVDSSDYGVIPADTADFIYKPFTQVANSFNVTGFIPPSSGTLNYLVQAQGITTDTDSASRPFFNATNPTSPIFQTVNQTRLDGIQYSTLSATAPSIPTPTAGWVGLYVVSVTAGQTSITSGNITVYSGAPFITESLTQKISTATGDVRYVRPFQIQSGQFVYGVDNGLVNVLAVNLGPIVTSLTAGTNLYAKVKFTNTGASTLNLNGLGATNITLNDGSSLSGGEMQANMIAELIYDGTNFQLMNAFKSSVAPGTIIDFGGTVVPTGYLACNGSAVSRTTYSALFSSIGTTWGIGDGSTTFNLPNLPRHFKMGSGGIATAIVGNTVGSTGGSENPTLVSHIHTLPGQTGGQNDGPGPSGSTNIGTAIAGTDTGATGDVSSAGKNVPPTAVVLMCIKT